MKRTGTFFFIAGLVLALLGMVAGFGSLAVDEDRQAVDLLMLVPLGFAAMLTGIVINQLTQPADRKSD